MSGPDGERWGSHLNPTLVDGDVWNRARARSANRIWTLGETLTTGATACLFGHARAWEHVAQQGQPWAIVMEDDVNYLHPKFDDFIRRLVQSNGTAQSGVEWDFLNLQPCGPFPAECERFASDHDVEVFPGDSSCAGMYIITKEGAKKALEAYFPLSKGRGTAVQLDGAKAFLRTGLRGHVACPPAAGQVGSAADTDVQILGSSVIDTTAKSRLVGDCPPLVRERMLVPALLDPESESVS